MPPEAFARAMSTEWYIGHGPVGDDGCPLQGIVEPFAAPSPGG
jgi:hypothetical protein